MIFPASGEFTRKSTNFTAASGFCVVEATDQYIEALYQSCASEAEPVIDGGRSTVTPPSMRASCATTWLDQTIVRPMRSVANSDWSIAAPESSTEVEASGQAPVSWSFCANSNRLVAVAASKPGAPSLYWSWPFCRIHTWNTAWTVAIWVMP